MSRSQYVWVVTAPGKGTPVAAFTVKHELVRWLGEHTPYEVDIARFRDQKPVWLDPCTLEPRDSSGSTPATLIEWIRNPQGSRDVDGDLYMEVVEGGVQVRRVSGSHTETLSSHVMWHLAQLEDDQTARLAITEMYDDAAAATDEPGS